MFSKTATVEAKSMEESKPREEAKVPGEEAPSNPEEKEETHPYEWMTKPCDFYKEEYSDCRSFKERFNQYFIFGEMQECSQWNEDYKNCRQWRDKQDREALEKLVASEKTRVRTRLQNHYRNNVWENRESPPEDWNKPLPPEIAKGYEGSYLLKMKDEFDKDLDRGIPVADDLEESSCCIM